MKLHSIAAAAVLAGAIAAPFAMHPVSSVRHAVPAKRTCATMDVEVKVKNGMPANYVLTFCGAGIKPGTWDCPRSSYQLPAPGELMNCTHVSSQPAKS